MFGLCKNLREARPIVVLKAVKSETKGCRNSTPIIQDLETNLIKLVAPICYAQCTFLVFIITLEMEGRPKWGEVISEGAFLYLQDIGLMFLQ